jgi:hypothetical protein
MGLLPLHFNRESDSLVTWRCASPRTMEMRVSFSLAATLTSILPSALAPPVLMSTPPCFLRSPCSEQRPHQCLCEWRAVGACDGGDQGSEGDGSAAQRLYEQRHGQPGRAAGADSEPVRGGYIG